MQNILWLSHAPSYPPHSNHSMSMRTTPTNFSFSISRSPLTQISDHILCPISCFPSQWVPQWARFSFCLSLRESVLQFLFFPLVPFGQCDGVTMLLNTFQSLTVVKLNNFLLQPFETPLFKCVCVCVRAWWSIVIQTRELIGRLGGATWAWFQTPPQFVAPPSKSTRHKRLNHIWRLRSY